VGVALAVLQPGRSSAEPVPPPEAPASASTPAPAPAQVLPPPSPSTPTVPTPTAAPTPAAPPEGWLDISHEALSRAFLWPVVTFDQFFSDEREVNLPRARSFLRVRNGFAIRDDGTFSYAPGVLAELVFPSLGRRLDRVRLVFASGAPDPRDRLIRGLPRRPDEPNRANAGLRLSLFESVLTQTDLQAGLLFRLPPGWYGRVRFRHAQPLAEALVARFALSVFWQTNTGWGTRQDLDLEHPLLPWLLLRLANSGTVTERSRGWEWSSELALLAADWPRSAVSISAAALGATRVGPVVEVWRAQLRARHDIFRRWIFLEVNPEIVWTRLEGGHQRRVRAVILLLEVQFDASSRRKRPPAAPPAG
jgi:hypothetical protein